MKNGRGRNAGDDPAPTGLVAQDDRGTNTPDRGDGIHQHLSIAMPTEPEPQDPFRGRADLPRRRRLLPPLGPDWLLPYLLEHFAAVRERRLNRQDPVHKYRDLLRTLRKPVR